MAESVVLAGVTYTIPDPGDSPNWATGLTPYLVAIAANVASNPTFIQYVAVAATPTTAISGKTYLITTASLAITMNLPTPAQNAWFMFKDVSNNAASNNITLHRNASEQIDGTSADKVLKRSGGTWVLMCDGTNWWSINEFSYAGNDVGLVNADIASAAAIAVSKLGALTIGRALQSNASTGLIEVATTTSTELGFLSGVTSAIQTQFAGTVKNPMTANLVGGAHSITLQPGTNLASFDGTGTIFQVGANYDLGVIADATKSACNINFNTPASASSIVIAAASAINTGTSAIATFATAALTMAAPIAMASNKITGLAAGTVNGDAIRFEQVNGTRILQTVTTRSTALSSVSGTSYVDTTTIAAITPSSVNSVIKITITGAVQPSNSSPGATDIYTSIFRGGVAGTNLGDATKGIISTSVALSANAPNQYWIPCTMCIYDSPATTSSVTYKVGIRGSNSNNSVNWGAGQGNAVFLLEEIG